MSTFDPDRFKQQERAGFNLIAARYERASQPLTPVHDRMLQLARLSPGQHVLDVASGPGQLARAAARMTRSAGVVTALDLAEETLVVARARAAAEALSNVRFEIGDAERLSFPDASFDRALCGLGLMHFPDATAALREMHRVLKSGGRIAVCVWGERAQVPLIACALATLERNLPPPKVERPSMFRFGDPVVLNQLLQDCGFAAIEVERVIITPVFSNAAEYWKGFLDLAGVTTVALSRLPQETQERLAADVARDLAPYSRGDGFQLDSTVVIATAERSG